MHARPAADSDTDSAPSGSPRRVAFYPHLPPGDPTGVPTATPAAFVLLASRRTLRLYAIDNLVSANRTTLYKAELDAAVVTAAAFTTREEQRCPGIVMLTADNSLLVTSLVICWWMLVEAASHCS